MLDQNKVGELREFLLAEFTAIRHPFDERDKTKIYSFKDLPRTAEAFLSFLCLECREERLRAVGFTFIDEFHRYYEAKQGERSKRASAVKALCLCFEPFLKKVAYFRYPGEKVWHGGLLALLEDEVLIPFSAVLKKTDSDYWKGRSAVEAAIRDTFHLRNPASHESWMYESRILDRYVHSILAACLFVAEENLKLLESISKVKREWIAYLRYLLRRFDDTEWQKEIYLPLRREGPTADTLGLRQRIDRFLADEHESVLLVVGRPGAGKTTLLKRQVYSLATDALKALQDSLGIQRPEKRIPIYVNLQGYPRHPQESLFEYIGNSSKLEMYIKNESIIQKKGWEEGLRGLSIPALVCLDAVDEMDSLNRAAWARSMREIDEFLDTIVHPGLKAIVTCRLSVVPSNWQEKHVAVEIAPLEESDIYQYLVANLKKDRAEQAFQFITNGGNDSRMLEELQELLQVPLLLRALVTYWELPSPIDVTQESEGDERPTLGDLVGHIFDTVFRWEQDKSPLRGWSFVAENWKEKVAQLACWMDGKLEWVSRRKATELFARAARRSNHSGKEHRRDLILLRNMGVLRSHPNGVRCFNSLARIYFTAWRLRLILEEEETNLQSFEQEAVQIGYQAWQDQQGTGLSNKTSAFEYDRSFWQPCNAILQDITRQDLGSLYRRWMHKRDSRKQGGESHGKHVS